MRWIRACTQAAPSPRRYLLSLFTTAAFWIWMSAIPLVVDRICSPSAKVTLSPPWPRFTRTLVTLGRKSYATHAPTAAFSTAILDPSCRASTLQRVPWARASESLRGSRSPDEFRRASIPIACRAMANCRKDPFGKPSCSPVRRSWTTCVFWWTATTANSISIARPYFPCRTLRRSSALSAGRRWTWTLLNTTVCTPRSMSFDTGLGMASRRPSFAIPPKAMAASPISLTGTKLPPRTRCSTRS